MAKRTDRGLENREIVLDILMEVLERGSFVHVVQRQALDKYQYLEKADRAFITRLTEGTLEYLIQIDFIINQYSKTKTQKMKPVIRNLLRLSVYQILYMDRVPDSAVCNEAVKLAAKRRFEGLKGFVNGVLRTIAREKEKLTFPEPWLELSLPRWMYEMWAGKYGPDTAAAMGKAFLSDKKTTVRCNLRALRREFPGISKEEAWERAAEDLREQGAEAAPLGGGLFYLSGYDRLEDLSAFGKGWIQVQDASSALVGELAAPEKGDYVIDVCAAPGGKSLHIADLLEGTGTVEARDLTFQKAELIEENIRRCGFENVRAVVMDALEEDGESVEKADILIADLPCSGLGILGKKPDIKQNMTPEKLGELAKLQRQILSVVWRYVKPGGRLIYSTCTVDSQENEENARWFAGSFPFEPVDLRPVLGERFEADSLRDGWIQFLPGIHPMDGFFISVFTRKKA
ncbi:MAG: 16S rRNA (cytosine(967)-C(5))-methyltransferase RsmB [Clostridium sp.]|nr:16S rRNA (cytosine(967)-C(5))-methyltransferase RsmB [Clostridium sp.]